MGDSVTIFKVSECDSLRATLTSYKNIDPSQLVFLK